MDNTSDDPFFDTNEAAVESHFEKVDHSKGPLPFGMTAEQYRDMMKTCGPPVEGSLLGRFQAVKDIQSVQRKLGRHSHGAPDYSFKVSGPSAYDMNEKFHAIHHKVAEENGFEPIMRREDGLWDCIDHLKDQARTQGFEEAYIEKHLGTLIRSINSRCRVVMEIKHIVEEGGFGLKQTTPIKRKAFSCDGLSDSKFNLVHTEENARGVDPVMPLYPQEEFVFQYGTEESVCSSNNPSNADTTEANATSSVIFCLPEKLIDVDEIPSNGYFSGNILSNHDHRELTADNLRLHQGQVAKANVLSNYVSEYKPRNMCFIVEESVDWSLSTSSSSTKSIPTSNTSFENKYPLIDLEEDLIELSVTETMDDILNICIGLNTISLNKSQASSPPVTSSTPIFSLLVEPLYTDAGIGNRSEEELAGIPKGLRWIFENLKKAAPSCAAPKPAIATLDSSSLPKPPLSFSSANNVSDIVGMGKEPVKEKKKIPNSLRWLFKDTKAAANSARRKSTSGGMAKGKVEIPNGLRWLLEIQRPLSKTRPQILRWFLA